MKTRMTKSHYSDTFATLLHAETVSRMRSQRRLRQRRSRKALVWVLFTLAIMVILVANVLTSGPNASDDGNVRKRHHQLKHERLRWQHTKDRYHRQVAVLNYEDIQDYYHHNEEQVQEEDSNNTVDSNGYEWSEEQIEEMNRYYKRYLEVFYEKNGHGFEPEPKEVVYTEYLAYRERKAMERAQRKQASQTQTRTSDESKTQGQEDTTKREQDTTPVEQEEEYHNEAPTSASIKHNPYWEDFDEVGGDLPSSSINDTETLPANIVVVGWPHADNNSTTSTIQPLTLRSN